MMKQVRIILAAIAAASVILLAACNNADTPEQAIKNFNSKMNDCNYKAAFNYVSEYDGLSFDEGDKNGTKQIVNSVSKTLDIEILDIQTSGATGAAMLNITTVDLRSIYSKAANTVTNNYVDTVLKGSKISAEDMRDALVEEIARESALSDAKRITTECKINLTKEKDKWYLILDSTSFNVIMGYMNEANAMVESGEFTDLSGTVSNSDVSSTPTNNSDEESSDPTVSFND